MVSAIAATDTDRQSVRRGSRATTNSGDNRRGSVVKDGKDGKAKKETAATEAAGSRKYQLGDCLGKGAFGSVYRALNWGTGETVAVKQVRLADLPKTELRVIMLEIDLLKNLHHPNIVKYHGFEMTSESLHIILEYCENGSLHTICKNFGKFPENLVALYMSQVLHGLLYLHEQGVIHRDIKGANILTTKEGLVKLADFGVATRTTGLDEANVVGTPYWMAPEVIELSGATTASDIWSLGCTVIELLDGRPPYHKLQPMPALFRIVNDDHPPFPEGTSPAARDFLMQCFQKDPNLRVSAKKLLKHPWIVNAKKTGAIVQTKPTKYDEAVKSVQEWNEAIKSPKNNSVRLSALGTPAGAAGNLRDAAYPTISQVSTGVVAKKTPLNPTTNNRKPPAIQSRDIDIDDNWDDAFAGTINPDNLQLPQLRPRDNFGGQLSSDKLKAYASHENSSLSSFGDLDTELTVKSPIQLNQSSPLETVRQLAPSGIPTISKDSRKPPRRVPSIPKVSLKVTRSRVSRPSTSYKEDTVEDYSDLTIADEASFAEKVEGYKTGLPPIHDHALSHTRRQSNDEDSFLPQLFHPSDLKSTPKSTQMRRSSRSKQMEASPPGEDAPAIKRQPSSVEIHKYAEDDTDADFTDVLGPLSTFSKAESDSGSEASTLMLSSKLSMNSLLEEDEFDPFAQFEQDFEDIDLETNVVRDRYARLSTLVENLIESLKTSETDDDLEEVADQLMQVLYESPDLKNVIVSSHGMLPILEILETMPSPEVTIRLLKVVNMIVLENQETQDNICSVGGIPIITHFANKKFPIAIRLEAAAFVRQVCQTSSLTLQMFIACGGLNVLVDFLEEDFDTERDIVLIGVNGLWSVFQLQGPTPKNDFCRILSRSAILYPMSLVLNKVIMERGELSRLVAERIVEIFFIFSQAETHVKELVADRMVLKRALKDLQRMYWKHQITMLKFFKNLSMLASTHEALQNSNAIEVLTDLLGSSMKLVHFREISNQVLSIMYNLCRVSKTRQEDAALNGLIPLLQHIVQTEWPLKEFALPILCEMAHSGKVGRKMLWQNKGLSFYISLLADKYWQDKALAAILTWLQEETARVEQQLVQGTFSKAMGECFSNPEVSADTFEKTVDLLQQILHLSPPVAASLNTPGIFGRTLQKLNTKNPRVRKDLLHVIRCICNASEEQGTLIRKYSLYEPLRHLAQNDPGILVRQMASGLVELCDESSSGQPKRRQFRRTSSSNSATSTPPASLISSASMPPTPTYSRTGQSRSFYDGGLEASRSRSSLTPSYRPTSREGNGVQANGLRMSSSNANLSTKSRAPVSRPSVSRLARLSIAGGTRREENLTPNQSPSQSSLGRPPALSTRRRRQTSSEVETSKYRNS